MTDFNNFNRPHINKGIPSSDDGKKKGEGKTSGQEHNQAQPAPIAYEKASPDSIFSALQAQGLGQQDKIAESRIAKSLNGMPSVEEFNKFEVFLDEEFPGLSALQKSDVAATFFGGSVEIQTA